MKAQIIVWSKIGDTPLTGRGGSYCDTLASVEIEVNDPGEARRKAVEMIRTIPGGHYAHYIVPEWWNQNTRSGWTHGR